VAMVDSGAPAQPEISPTFPDVEFAIDANANARQLNVQGWSFCVARGVGESTERRTITIPEHGSVAVQPPPGMLCRILPTRGGDRGADPVFTLREKILEVEQDNLEQVKALAEGSSEEMGETLAALICTDGNLANIVDHVIVRTAKRLVSGKTNLGAEGIQITLALEVAGKYDLESMTSVEEAFWLGHLAAIGRLGELSEREMTVTPEVEKMMTRSKRREVLALLDKEPLLFTEIQDALEIKATPLNRALRDLTQHRLVDHPGRMARYAITDLGQYVSRTMS